MDTLLTQTAYLLLLSVPVACVAWTVTHEEVFREPREYCLNASKRRKTILGRKFFYLFTCEYCFSHYVAVLFLFITKFHLLLPDWRGYVIAGFSLVWIANLYMSVFALIKVDIRKERLDVKQREENQ